MKRFVVGLMFVVCFVSMVLVPVAAARADYVTMRASAVTHRATAVSYEPSDQLMADASAAKTSCQNAYQACYDMGVAKGWPGNTYAQFLSIGQTDKSPGDYDYGQAMSKYTIGMNYVSSGDGKMTTGDTWATPPVDGYDSMMAESCFSGARNDFDSACTPWSQSYNLFNGCLGSYCHYGYATSNYNTLYTVLYNW